MMYVQRSCGAPDCSGAGDCSRTWCLPASNKIPSLASPGLRRNTQVCGLSVSLPHLCYELDCVRSAETCVNLRMHPWHRQSKQDRGWVLGRTVKHLRSHALAESGDVPYRLAQGYRRKPCCVCAVAAWSIWTSSILRWKLWLPTASVSSLSTPCRGQSLHNVQADMVLACPGL